MCSATAKGAIADARKEIDSIAKKGGIDAIAGGGRALDQANARVNQLELSLADSVRRAEEARNALEGVEAGTDEWRRLTNQILDAEAATARFSSELQAIPSGLAGGAGADIVGRSDTALAAAAGLAGGLGAAPGAEVLGLGADVLGAVDAFGQLGEELEDATGAAGLLGKAAGGIAANAGPLAAIGIAIAGITLAFGEFVATLEAGKQAIDDLGNAREQEIRDELEFAEFRRTASAEQIDERRRALEEETVVLEKLLEQQQGDIVRALEAVGDTVDPVEAIALAAALEEIEFQISETEKRLAGATSELELFNEEIAGTEIKNVFGGAIAAALDYADATELVEEANRQATDAEQARVDAIENDARVLDQAVTAMERFDDAIDKIADTAEKATAKAETQAEKDIAKIGKQAEKSREKEAKSHTKKLAEIQKKGNEDLAELQAEFAAIDIDAVDERKKAIEEFNKDVLELEQERQKEEIRLQQEHDQTLLDAVLDRNVQAFILEQRRFEQEKIDRAEDDPVAERGQALNEELAAIEERRQAEIAANQAQIVDTRRRIAEQQTAEEEAHKERLEAIAEREEEAKQARREALEEQKQAIKDTAREQTEAANTAFREQLTNLQNNLSTETETKNAAYQAQLTNLHSFVTNANAQFAALAGATSAAIPAASLPSTTDLFGGSAGATVPSGFGAGFGATATGGFTSTIGTVNVNGAPNNAAMEASATAVFNAAQQDSLKKAAGVI
jgi:hypothetical protein